MAITLDGASKRIVLDSASVTAAQIWSAWVDWHGSHPQWLLAFRQVGGDALGGGLFIPAYFFLQNGWRVRPMEADQTLTITGNLFVDGGGDPVVPTLGNFKVLTKLVVPVQAQGIATGGGSAPTAAEVAAAVLGSTVENGLTLEQTLRVILAPLSGKATGIGTGTESYLSQDGAKPRVTATFDSAGNRTAVTVDGT